MAIPCPRCGRQYDVTLFQFGRTIHCTCGARVGREADERRLDFDGEPRFFCDAMLGRLARWLRALGVDTAYVRDIEDGVLVSRAIQERRVILTRDRRLPVEWRVGGCVVLESDTPLDRVREVADRFGLEWPRELFSRCLECNTPLEGALVEDVAGAVPTRVLRDHDRFRRCPSCHKVFWEGSHVRRMRRSLERVFEPSPDD